MKYRLYSDSSVWHREYPASAKLSDIMSAEGITGRARLIREAGDSKEYRVDGSGFKFEIRDVY